MKHPVILAQRADFNAFIAEEHFEYIDQSMLDKFSQEKLRKAIAHFRAALVGYALAVSRLQEKDK